MLSLLSFQTDKAAWKGVIGKVETLKVRVQNLVGSHLIKKSRRSGIELF